MYDVTRPITHMKKMVDDQAGYLDGRIEGKCTEARFAKSGINATAVSLSEYHVEMQHSIDQATEFTNTWTAWDPKRWTRHCEKESPRSRERPEFLANMSHLGQERSYWFHPTDAQKVLYCSQTDYLQTIEKSADNLLSIIKDILDFSKLEAGKLVLEVFHLTFKSLLKKWLAHNQCPWKRSRTDLKSRSENTLG